MKEDEPKKTVTSGVPMSEEELKEWKQSFENILESINDVLENGEDL